MSENISTQVCGQLRTLRFAATGTMRADTLKGVDLKERPALKRCCSTVRVSSSRPRGSPVGCAAVLGE